MAFEFRGYAKNLGIRSQSFFTRENFLLDVSRVRAQGLVDVGSRLHAEFWVDTELLVGDFLRTPDYAFSQALEQIGRASCRERV